MNVPRNLKVTCLKENVFVVDEMATLILMVQLTNNINEILSAKQNMMISISLLFIPTD